MLPGNKTLDPEVRVLGAGFSTLWQYFLWDVLCNLEKMIDFQARPIRVSLLAFLLIICVTFVNLHFFFELFKYIKLR